MRVAGPAASHDPEPGRGLASWLCQRLTGLFLAFFVGVHVVMLHFVREWHVDVSSIVARMKDNPTMVAFYGAFVPVVVYHGLNGVWGIVLDLGPGPRSRRAVAAGLWIVGAVTTVYGFYVLRALTRLV